MFLRMREGCKRKEKNHDTAASNTGLPISRSALQSISQRETTDAAASEDRGRPLSPEEISYYEFYQSLTDCPFY